MPDIPEYQAQKELARVRDKLSSGQNPAPALSGVFYNLSGPALVFAEDVRIEASEIPGWSLYFIPAEGPLAGQNIRRTFIIGPDGQLQKCLELMREKYGQDSHCLAGRCLCRDESFGVWE